MWEHNQSQTINHYFFQTAVKQWHHSYCDVPPVLLAEARVLKDCVISRVTVLELLYTSPMLSRTPPFLYFCATV